MHIRGKIIVVKKKLSKFFFLISQTVFYYIRSDVDESIRIGDYLKYQYWQPMFSGYKWKRWHTIGTTV